MTIILNFYRNFAMQKYAKTQEPKENGRNHLLVQNVRKNNLYFEQKN